MRAWVTRALLAAALLASGCSDCRGAPDNQGPQFVPDEKRAAGWRMPGAAAPSGSASPAASASAGAPAKSVADATAAFVKVWVAGYNAHDATATSALYAPDAVQQLAGNPADEGREAIKGDHAGTFERYADTKVTVGRVWIGPNASVVEYVFGGTRAPGEVGGIKVGAKRVGIPAVRVLRFDREGLVTTDHLYLDLATNLGQLDPKLLPAGFDKVRAPTTAPPAGADVLESKGTPVESRNLDTLNKLYGAFGAHAIDDAMALFTDDFVLEDFTTPGPQRKADVRKHAAAVLAAIPDFKLARATVIAAGDDVVVESSVAGTFTAALGPIQPTGKPVLVHELDVWRLENGKISRQWSYSNEMEVLTQLGVVKPRAP
jgi:steroid delta-isomerase-like uncharacterized protein